MLKIKEVLTNDTEIQLNVKVRDIGKPNNNTKMFKAAQEMPRKKF